MAYSSTLLSILFAVSICQALSGALPEEVYAPGPAATNRQPEPSVRAPQQSQFTIKDTLKQLWDSMDPSSGEDGSPSKSPPSDHDKYEMVKNLQVTRDVRGDKCNRSALASLNSLADVAAHLYSEGVSDYVSFYRNKQFKLCKGPAIGALRELLAEDEAQVEGDGANRRLESVVDLGERIRRQGKKVFGSTETRRALVMYLHDKELHPLDISGGDKTTFYITMDHLLDNICHGVQEPHIVEVLDVLDQLHGDHSITWEEFVPNEINFIVGSIGCRDIFEDKQAYIGHLYTVALSGEAGF